MGITDRQGDTSQQFKRKILAGDKELCVIIKSCYSISLDEIKKSTLTES